MGTLTAIFRTPDQAARAVQQLRGLGLDGNAVQTEEKKGGLLEALLPDEERSDETRVTVSAGDQDSRVHGILQQNGALRIEGERSTPADATNGEALPLVSEELYPQTTVVQVGEVVVRKVVVTEMRTFEVPIRREEIVVERAVLYEPLAAPAGNRFEQQVTSESGETQTPALGADEEVIRIPILEEQVTVEKHPVVREEVRVLKRRVHDVVTVSEPVRREEPVMEQTFMTGDGGSVPGHVLTQDEIADDQPRQYQ